MPEWRGTPLQGFLGCGLYVVTLTRSYNAIQQHFVSLNFDLELYLEDL